MSLQDRLNEKREKSYANLPPEKLAIMKNATDSLRKPEVVSRILKVGDTAPSFNLQDENGIAVSSEDILRNKPLVTIFYRGVW